MNQKSKTTKVYIASTLSNWKRIRSLRDQLANRGIELTYDWTQWGKDIYGSGTKVRPAGIKSDEQLVKTAMKEVNGVQDADAILLVLPGERGSHFELAIAWAARKPIIILTDGETAPRPTSFHYLPRIERTDNEQVAIDRTVELARTGLYPDRAKNDLDEIQL